MRSWSRWSESGISEEEEEVCAVWMVRMLNVCLNIGSVPNEWKIGCVVLIYI